MSFGPLIDVPALAALIARGQVRVCDCRFDLSDPTAGGHGYEQGHVPSAIHVDLEHDLSGVSTGSNGRHPLPDLAVFAARMAAAGIDADLAVVTYDTSGGVYAGRLWWMLRWIGHARVAVLDGGLAAWTAAGHALQSGRETAPPGRLESLAPAMPHATAAQIETDPALVVVDARSAERFAGVPHPLDARPGHIPGARNRFYGSNLQPDGGFKPADQLRREFAELLDGTPPEQVVHQCGSGVTATLNLLAMEAAGLPGSRLYSGSWSEWSSDPRREIAI